MTNRWSRQPEREVEQGHFRFRRTGRQAEAVPVRGCRRGWNLDLDSEPDGGRVRRVGGRYHAGREHHPAGHGERPVTIVGVGQGFKRYQRYSELPEDGAQRRLSAAGPVESRRDTRI